MAIRGNGHNGTGEMSAWLKGLLAKLEEGSRENRAMIREIKADNRKQDARIAILEDRAYKHQQDIAEGRRQNREIVTILANIEVRNQREHEEFLKALAALNVRLTRVEKKR